MGGTDILSRIFTVKIIGKKLEEVRRATVESICECMDKLDASLEMQGTPSEQKTENNGVSESCDDRGAKNAAQKARSISRSALSMVIAGNTTMIHFLLGMDAFAFSTHRTQFMPTAPASSWRAIWTFR